MALIDPSKALPLYHQIAELIRGRIAAGDLRVGDSLESMRGAAARYRVNLHTVRHAYLALSRDGLVEMLGARGTRVISDHLPTSFPHESDVPVSSFVRDMISTAESRYGLTARALAARITASRPAASDQLPRIAVVECSDWQCRSHVDEISRSWNVAAHPHPILTEAPPAGDTIVATWFHYNDVRRRWPDLLHRVEFVTIRPDLSAMPDRSAEMWWIVERDEATAGAVAGDLIAALDQGSLDIRPHVTNDPATAVAELPGDNPILLSPRVWAELDGAVRDDPRAFELRYVIDADELKAIADRHRWRRQSSMLAEGARSS